MWNLTDISRIPLSVELMLPLCQKAFQTLVCKLPNIIASITKYILVQVLRLGLFIENGISRVQNVDSALVQLSNGRIKDVKFMDDKILLVLWESNGERL
jgi:hypothetical protein